MWVNSETGFCHSACPISCPFLSASAGQPTLSDEQFFRLAAQQMHWCATCSSSGHLGSLIPQTLCNSLHCPSSQANSQPPLISVVHFCCSLQLPFAFLQKPFKGSINVKFYLILQIVQIEFDALGCWIGIPDYLHLTTMSPPQRVTCGWPQGPASLYLPGAGGDWC